VQDVFEQVDVRGRGNAVEDVTGHCVDPVGQAARRQERIGPGDDVGGDALGPNLEELHMWWVQYG
jgi:hypothetical protein